MESFKKVRLTVAVAAAILLSGCATHSDKLGFAEDESTLTYAQAYEPARTWLNNGQFDELRAVLNQNSTKEVKEEVKDDGGVVRQTARAERLSNDEEMERLIKEQSELAIVERGLLTLNVGDFERALFYFNAAEEKLNLDEADDSVGSAAASMGKTGLAGLIGSEEMANYEMRGYEKVMLLNYKALCYMLLGDRKAYNVTRRAIDLQQEEWEKFQQLLAESKEKSEQSELSGSMLPLDKVDDRTDEVKDKAALVSSAYVNPFGDYLNAMMMEIDGFDDPTMRQNAKIAYRKVVENNKDCLTARAAVKYVERGLPKNLKLVQVILSDGFAPVQVEKSQAIEIPWKDKTLNAVVNYANATPVETSTAAARVMIGPKSFNLSTLTKMESLILRDEADRMPMRATMFALALLRSAAANNYLGNFGTMLTSAVQHPDTRSWLTLPNQVYVARLAVPANMNSIQIQTVGHDGQTLASKKVNIAEKGPTVVYAVSYGQNVKAYANAFSWVE